MIDEEQNLGPIGKLVRELTRLPGVGPKSAERLTFYLLSGDRQNARDLAGALQAVAETVKPCPECGNLADGPLCAVCSNPRRDPAILCVVETPRDLAVFERAGFFRGRYHVLGGRLAPLDNMGPEQLATDALLRRVQKGGVTEVILATSPTLEGDGTALYVSNLLAPTGVKITRLARGLPSGTSLDLVNAQMLSDAVEGRRAF
jgi:recombination protein RecR